jgi:hypothetical protein
MTATTTTTNSEEQVTRALGVIGRLTRLLQDENDILRVPGRPQGMDKLQVEKETLSKAYEQEIKLLGEAEGVKKLKPEQRSRLKEAANSLVTLMEDNRRRIEAKLEATRQVFQIIADAAKEYRAASSGYGRNGTSALPTRAAYRPALSVGVDRKL